MQMAIEKETSINQCTVSPSSDLLDNHGCSYLCILR